MQKWEYEVIGFPIPIDIRRLNDLGEQGWEAVSWAFLQTGTGLLQVEFTILLKRPKA